MSGFLINPFRFATGLARNSATARYWRVGWQESMTGANPSASRVEFIDGAGGTIVPAGGTALSGGDLSGSFPATAAFDENDATYWVAVSTTVDNDTVDQWVGYDFGDGNDQTISGVTVRSRPDSFGVNEGVRFGVLQYSSDGVSWTTLFRIINNEAYSASGTTRTWQDDPVYEDGHRYWRMVVSGVQGGGGDRFSVQQVSLHVDNDTATDIVEDRQVITDITSSTPESAIRRAVKAMDGVSSSRFADFDADQTGTITWDFGPANAPNVTHVSVTNSDETFGPDESPSDWVLEYSDDGVGWTTVVLNSGDIGWTQNETRTFSTILFPGTVYQTNAEGIDDSTPSTGISETYHDQSHSFAGDCVISTDDFQFGTSALYSGGAGSIEVTPSNEELDFGDGDFSIEFFFNRLSAAADDFIINIWDTAGARAWTFVQQSDDGLVFTLSETGSGGYNRLGLGLTDILPVDGELHHIVVCRVGTTMSMFIDGPRVDTVTDSTAIYNTGGAIMALFRISGGGGNNTEGYLDGIRIVKGNSPYDPTASSITVPTSYADYFRSIE